MSYEDGKTVVLEGHALSNWVTFYQSLIATYVAVVNAQQSMEVQPSPEEERLSSTDPTTINTLKNAIESTKE